MSSESPFSASVPRTVADAAACVCGDPATTTVSVQWADRRRRYRYCEECAANVVTYIEGAHVVR